MEYITLNNGKQIPRFLYKYGNLDNPQWFLDIIMNNRLYAGTLMEMNDPMEGEYRSKTFLTNNEFEDTFNAKTKNRFCSLTTSPYLHLMWAYYAKSHKGYCIEIDMKTSEYNEQDLCKINYSSDLPYFDKNVDGAIRNILCHKYTDWGHEDEWRYFVTGSEYWSKVKVTNVYFRENIGRRDYNFYYDIIKGLNKDIDVQELLKERLNEHHIDTTDKSKIHIEFHSAKKNIKEFVEKVIANTFDTLVRIYNGGKGINGEFKGSRLIFPKYKKEKKEGIRVSEQELRFVFVEEFSKLCNDGSNNYYYSVETPTEGDYTFNEDAKNPHAADKGEGQSGNFDMAIHDMDGKKVCLIEFKAHNVGQEKIEKDIVKLTNTKEGDDNILRYLIHIVPASDNGTTKNIENKLGNIENKIEKDDRYSEAVSYCCYSLREQKMINTKSFNKQIENDKQ